MNVHSVVTLVFERVKVKYFQDGQFYFQAFYFIDKISKVFNKGNKH